MSKRIQGPAGGTRSCSESGLTKSTRKKSANVSSPLAEESQKLVSDFFNFSSKVGNSKVQYYSDVEVGQKLIIIIIIIINSLFSFFLHFITFVGLTVIFLENWVFHKACWPVPLGDWDTKQPLTLFLVINKRNLFVIIVIISVLLVTIRTTS